MPQPARTPRYAYPSPLLIVSAILLVLAYIMAMLARPTTVIPNILKSSFTINTTGALNRISLLPAISNQIPFQFRHLTTTPKMSSENIDKISFVDAVTLRRSIYTLDKNLPISDTRVKELVETAMKHVPSSFDSQTTRLVVLLNADHDQFWDYVWEALQPHLHDADKKAASKQRIDGFRNGYGTVRRMPSSSLLPLIYIHLRVSSMTLSDSNA